jgi:cytochrome c oxidase subunit 4
MAFCYSPAYPAPSASPLPFIKALSKLTLLPAYFISFGPHGPRAPINPPGQGIKVFAGTIAAIAAALSLFAFARSRGK